MIFALHTCEWVRKKSARILVGVTTAQRSHHEQRDPAQPIPATTVATPQSGGRSRALGLRALRQPHLDCRAGRRALRRVRDPGAQSNDPPKLRAMSARRQKVFVMPNRYHDFFLARQPILDRRGRVVAYELLYRAEGSSQAGVTDHVLATSRVITRSFGDLGVRTVLGGRQGFINLDAASLMSGMIESLPRSGCARAIGNHRDRYTRHRPLP